MTVQPRLRRIGREARSGLVLLLAGFLALGPGAARANPEIQEVVSGQVDMQPGGNQVDVTNGSIANYTQFDISHGDSFRVQFVEGAEIPGNHLARVVNGFETQIHGTLTSNGHVYLVNPAGITIGPTGKVGDMPGFHAAAGDMKLDPGPGSFGARTERIDSRDRFINLTGEVVNKGEINAEVVDLIGRYVENSGAIYNAPASDPSDPSDPLNGYFVLAAGEDVIVVRSTNETTGRTSISLTIPGAAQEVLDALGATEQFGIELASTSVINAADGGVTVGARVETGAGDLFGTAIRFGAGSYTKAAVLEAEARGADLVLGAETGDPATTAAAELEATQMTLCAGEICREADPVDPDALDAIRAPVAAKLTLVAPEDPDEAAELSLASDAAFEFVDADGSPLQIAAERERLDLEILAQERLTLGGHIEARNFTGSAKVGDVTGLPRVRGNVSIEPDTTFTAETVVLEGEVVEGVANETTTFETGDLEITQADDLLIDDAYADRVSGDRSLKLSSLQALDVTASELAADEIELRAGLGLLGGDLTIGAPTPVPEDPEAEPEPPDPVTIRADKVTLSATLLNNSQVPLDPGLQSRVVVHDNATIRSDSGRVGEFSLTQEAAIFGDRIPTREQLGEDGDDAGTDYARSYTSTGGIVSVDEEAAERIFGAADDPDRPLDFADPDLELNLDSELGVEIKRNLEARALKLRGGGREQSVNLVTGDLRATGGDLSITGDTVLGTEDALVNPDPSGQAEIIVDQFFASDAGNLTIGGLIGKVTGGTLTLSAPRDVPEGENPAIQIEADIIVQDGNLDIQNGFSSRGGNFAVGGTVAPDDSDRDDHGILTIRGSADPDREFRSVLSEGADQFLAREIHIESGASIEKTDGSLAIIASRVVILDVDPTSKLTLGGTVKLAPPTSTEDDDGIERILSLASGGSLELYDTAELTADSIRLSAGRSGEGGLEVGLPEDPEVVTGRHATLHADVIELSAGRIGVGATDDTETTTVVEVAPTVEFRDADGLLAPERVLIQQGVAFSVADAPTDADGNPI
ncbi:MAG: filamentous hemagglutinin N-terminal domain-containing protein, partial [Deltaproteobacteria bacterium]|nr:filamentous hemagglutinin N-terminal domain-containing protein [Deltaproteobacteria bacterium]